MQLPVPPPGSVGAGTYDMMVADKLATMADNLAMVTRVVQDRATEMDGRCLP